MKTVFLIIFIALNILAYGQQKTRILFILDASNSMNLRWGEQTRMESAKDILITSQLRTSLILNKKIKATNYQIDTYKKRIYIYGIAITSNEKDQVIKEAKEILDVEDVIASILLVDDLRIQKD